MGYTSTYTNFNAGDEAIFNAWCGWKLVNTENAYNQERDCWLAAWRYNNSGNYCQEGGKNFTLEIDGNYTTGNGYQISVKKFKIECSEYTHPALTLKWYPAGYAMGAYMGLYSYANLFDQNGISRTRLINAINNITTLYSNGKTTITISSIDNQPIFIRFQK